MLSVGRLCVVVDSLISTAKVCDCVISAWCRQVCEVLFNCGFGKKKKAFDTVNHSILLLKLHHYGVRGKAYEWFHAILPLQTKTVCVC